MKLIYSQSRSENQRYVPVALGNGDLSFQIDGGGAMEQRGVLRHDTRRGPRRNPV